MIRCNIRRPLLGLVAFLTALVISPGEPGNVDTNHRLQVTHSFWTADPPVAPGDYPQFGIVGRNGRIHAWYGMGQSLLMLPSDIVGTALAKVLPRANSDEVRRLVVSYTVSPLICTLSVLVCFSFLRRLDFPELQAAIGSLALLFGTTVLHYTQNMMENNFIFLLTLTGFSLHYEWIRSRSKRALAAGSLALAANFLTRLTTVIDAVAVAAFVLMCLYLRGERGRLLVKNLTSYLRTCLPFYAAGLGIDRLYHFYRFGECCSGYIEIYARQLRQLDPSLSVASPKSELFWEGLLGPFISPEKSVFLFDPLLIVLLLVVLVHWNRLSSEVKAYITVVSAALLLYVLFYALYTASHPKLILWNGDVAWGDRYVESMVDLLALLAVPLLLRFWPFSRPFFRRCCVTIAVISIVVQISSVLLWYPLEFRQIKALNRQGVFVIGLRISNLIAWANGNLDAWIPADHPEIRNIRGSTLYFYPFLVLHRGGFMPVWVGRILVGSWFVLLTALLWTLQSLLRPVLVPRERESRMVGTT